MNMNKLRKVGLSALAGSLAALSAQAGELAVSGSMEVTYVSRDGSEVTGNPIGTQKGISFTGNGELDNGYTVSMVHSMVDNMNAISSSVYTMTMGDLGTIAIHDGSAGPLAAIDNVMPTAYEEADHGMDTGASGGLPGAVGNSENIVVFKKNDLGGSGVNIGIGYSPNVGSGSANDSGNASNTGKGSGYEMAVTASNFGMDGLSLGLGHANINEGSSSAQNDATERTVYAKYAMNNWTFGYQRGVVDLDGATEYVSDIFGISFNINDNMSLSYQNIELEYDVASGTDVTAEYDGISFAYNMGPLAFKVANSDGDNLGGTTGATDENTEVSLSLSF
jgi:outer membrane protein OmpU